jgi:hypothetical protein
MKRTIPVRIRRGDRGFAAACLDLPGATQAPGLDGLATSISGAIGRHPEG